MTEQSDKSVLHVIASPIGNLLDLSDRSKQILSNSKLWIVEDTRVSHKLQNALNTKAKMLVLNDHTPDYKRSQYISEIQDVSESVLLSDAGTPGISDPGAELINDLWNTHVKIIGIPGPSAVTLLLSVSGFYAQRFVFLGFPPRNSGPITQLLTPYIESTMTLVVFESPHRIAKFCETALHVLGNRRICIGRELTKIHEELTRCQLQDVDIISKIPSKGELALVIEGYRKGTSLE